MVELTGADGRCEVEGRNGERSSVLLQPGPGSAGREERVSDAAARTGLVLLAERFLVVRQCFRVAACIHGDERQLLGEGPAPRAG